MRLASRASRCSRQASQDQKPRPRYSTKLVLIVGHRQSMLSALLIRHRQDSIISEPVRAYQGAGRSGQNGYLWVEPARLMSVTDRDRQVARDAILRHGGVDVATWGDGEVEVGPWTQTLSRIEFLKNAFLVASAPLKEDKQGAEHRALRQ